MLKSTAYIFNPIFLLIGWCVFFYTQQGLFVWASLSILSIILTAALTSGYHFWRHKLQWFNFLVIYLAQFSFLLMLKNSSARYLGAVVISALWSFSWWMLKQYFRNYLAPSQLEYLAFKKYWYILNLWFLLTSAYALIIFLSLHFYYLMLLVVLLIYSLAKDLFAGHKEFSWLFWLVTAFFFAQLFAVVYFLPVSFYVAGTFVVLWFYYFVSLAADDKKKSKRPIIIILAVTAFLLLSSLYIIL